MSEFKGAPTSNLGQKGEPPGEARTPATPHWAHPPLRLPLGPKRVCELLGPPRPHSSKADRPTCSWPEELPSLSPSHL